jgi:hypothetical protein
MNETTGVTIAAPSLITRRAALVKGAAGGGSLALAIQLGSIPLALAAMPQRLFGQSTPLEVLEFALLLENLEAEFYKAVLGVSSSTAFNEAFAPVRATLTADETAVMDQIRKHEVAHVSFLRAAITSLSATPTTYTPANFDFTGGNGSGTGPFAAATTDKAFLLAAAQAFEDTGVRAYKGQAGNLMSSDALLEAALRIHAVEARHAAQIRKLRATAGVSIEATGTITQEESGITGVPGGGQAIVDMVYAGEGNTMHTVFNGTSDATLNAATLPMLAQYGGTDAATAAFDEPLTQEQVAAIVAPFIVD